MPTTMSSAMTVVPHGIPSCEKKTSNAWRTPCVRLTLDAGTPTAIARVGRMKMKRMRIVARPIAFGNSRPGFCMSVTWTAFISMPA
jgi:hypothetical protein